MCAKSLTFRENLVSDVNKQIVLTTNFVSHNYKKIWKLKKDVKWKYQNLTKKLMQLKETKKSNKYKRYVFMVSDID